MIKINVSEFLQDEGAQEKSIEEEIEKIGGGIKLLENLKIKGKIFKIDDGVLARVEISGKEKMVCDRCMEEFEKKINKNFSQEFVLPSKNLQGEEKDDKQAGFIIDEKNEIDLEKPIIEEILLDNERNICKNDCKGICPKCGVNLNKEICKCNKKFKSQNSKFKIAFQNSKLSKKKKITK